MGSQASVNDRDQGLLEQQQINNDDSHLTIGQPIMKNTMAIKNPLLLKKETFNIERDSVERNIYYVKFKYDSLVDFKLNVLFKANSNLNTLDKDSLFLSSINNSNLTFNCAKGFDVTFDDINCKLDSKLFDKREGHEFDVVFEMIPIDLNTTEPVAFYTCISFEEVKDSSNKQFKHSVVSQRLRAQGLVLELNELYLAHRDQGECLICYEKLANTVLLPCRHSCCSGCAHNLRLRNLPCPMCKNSKFFYIRHRRPFNYRI